jgi:C_GCAxxG_C_C family probable redox protein
MTIEERAQKAMELKQLYGYNCCQAVTAALADYTDLSEDELVKLSAGFGTGMGNLEATCGSLIGAAMIAGLKSEGRGSMRLSRELSESFKSKCKATICKELKGVGTGKVLCPCELCVKNAVLAFGEVIGEK